MRPKQAEYAAYGFKHSNSLFAFDIRRTQPIILGFMWYSAGIPVVHKGTFCGTNFLRTVKSTFSLPFQALKRNQMHDFVIKLCLLLLFTIDLMN